MPKMSMTMTEGTFLMWHKAEGDRVRQGEVVCEVATDKVDMEVEATVDGTLSRLVAAPADVIEVGEPIAYVASESEDLLAGLLDTPAPAARQPATGAPAAVPAARRLAAERGVDLATITPTGPWHTIRLSDVDGAKPHTPHRRGAIARRMAASAAVPQFVLYHDIDLEAAALTRGEHPWTAVLTKVFAAALRRHPELNATWVDDQPRRHEQIGVAIAVDTPRGLLAPVLTDPDRHDLATLTGRIADVVGQAKSGRLALAELTTPATTTVSSLDVDAFQVLLTPPQATALAVGAVGPTVVPVPGGVGVRTRCTLGLTVDHRVADGAAGARLLATFQQLIDGPLV